MQGVATCQSLMTPYHNFVFLGIDMIIAGLAVNLLGEKKKLKSTSAIVPREPNKLCLERAKIHVGFEPVCYCQIVAAAIASDLFVSHNYLRR